MIDRTANFKMIPSLLKRAMRSVARVKFIVNLCDVFGTFVGWINHQVTRVLWSVESYPAATSLRPLQCRLLNISPQSSGFYLSHFLKSAEICQFQGLGSQMSSDNDNKHGQQSNMNQEMSDFIRGHILDFIL
jgi:hypothetical protein